MMLRTLLVTCSFLAFAHLTISAQPLADNCTSAIPITLDNEGHECAFRLTFQVNEDGTTSSGTPSSCDNNSNLKDKFFTWTAESTGILWFTYSYNTSISVYKNNGDSINPICGEEIHCGGVDKSAGILKGWNIGDDLIIRVASQNSSISFCLQKYTVLPPPPNNKCSQAIPLIVNSDLNCNSSFRDSTRYSDLSNTSTSCGSPINDVWYSFVAESFSQSIQFNNLSGEDDMYVQIYSGECDVLTQITCFSTNNYYYNAQAIGAGVNGLQPGQKYLVRVMTASNNPIAYNAYDICIGKIQNDICRNATDIDLSNEKNCIEIADSSFFYATKSNLQGSCDGNYRDVDNWHQFVAQSEAYIIGGDGNSNFDNLSIQLFDGDCSDLTEQYCFDFDYYNFKRRADLTIGESYYLRVLGERSYSTQMLCLERVIPTPVICGSTTAGSICNVSYGNESISFESNDIAKSLSLSIISGQLDNCCDVFTIHDGSSANSPVLFTTSLTNMPDTTILSTGNSLMINYISTSYTNCESGQLLPIQYSVQCVDAECPDNLNGSNMLTGDLSTNKLYQTNGIIESDQNIQTGSEVLYRAKNSVDLLPNFNVQNNATLSVEISECDN